MVSLLLWAKPKGGDKPKAGAQYKCHHPSHNGPKCKYS